MPSKNYVELEGRLGKDPELRYTKTQKPVARFSIACYNGKDKEGNAKTMWIDCEWWNDKAREYHKGQNIIVTGRITLDEWTNDVGHKQSKMRIAVSDVKLGEFNKPKEQEEHNSDGFDDDIPF